MRALIFLLAAIAFAVPTQAETPGPNTTGKWSRAVLGQNAELARTVELERLRDLELADAYATAARNVYEALVKKGFSRAEAMQILTKSGPLLQTPPLTGRGITIP